MTARRTLRETGEARWHAARDRRRRFWERLIALAVAVGGLIWLWSEGFFELGWDLVWIVPGFLILCWIWVGIEDAGDALIDSTFGGLARRFRARSYSEGEEEAPDYSMAERIDDERR